jgi:hypothetical protein
VLIKMSSQCGFLSRISSVVILVIMPLKKAVVSLPLVQSFFTRYGLSTLLALGNFGSVCNIIIFVRSRTHRGNSCSLYLLAAAFFNLIAIDFGLGTILYALNHQNPATVSEFFCKARAYIIHVVFNVSRWLVVFACVDRFALSHKQAHIRSWSSPRLARRAIALVACAWILIAIHVPIWQGIHVGACGAHGVYAFVWGIYQFLIVGVLPPFAMVTFGFLTLKNLHALHSRIRTTGNSTTVQLHPRDVNMIRMLSAEIFVYLLTNIGHPISQLYLTISDRTIIDKSIRRKEIEEFVLYLATSFLIYAYFCAPFYIYLIASRSFRQDFKSLFACCTGVRVTVKSYVNENVIMNNGTRKRSRQLPARQQIPIRF